MYVYVRFYGETQRVYLSLTTKTENGESESTDTDNGKSGGNSAKK